MVRNNGTKNIQPLTRDNLSLRDVLENGGGRAIFLGVSVLSDMPIPVVKKI